MNHQPTTDTQNWTKIIEPQSSLFSLNLKEVWRYRDLCYMFVRRDLVVQYKQTILGPLWYVIQPLMTTIIFTIIFGKVAKIGTDGIPQVLFYLSGLTCWGYFSTCLTATSTTFLDNQGVFGKVFFPRMTVPISVVISNLIKFGIQLVLFIAFWFYFFFSGANIAFQWQIVIFPMLVIIMAGLGLGFGMLFSSFTTKYRDLKFLLQFGVQLWMYATPIIYPLSTISQEHQWILALNPMTGIIEAFKFIFIGQGTFSWNYILYSFCFMVVLMLLATLVFNKVEKNFIDTV